ncbi:thioredoxin family protein [Flavobacterium flavipallidum]|uniref:Thioredoxin family protein n=1 Tax=Flavobacterium flavipallidum TaxID=3139140 RepID=A0ABU9HLE2_9FLAO
MKQRILTIILMLSVMTIYANGIVFTQGKWNEIKAKAKKENKLIFIDCYTSWCGPCKKMEKEIFSLKAVGEIFNANYVNYKMDMEKGEGIDLAKQYHIGAYPTFLWLNYKGEIIHRVVGYFNEKQFLEQSTKAINGGNYDQVLETNYLKNKSNPAIVKEYLDYLKQTADYRSIDVTKVYLSIIPEQEYTSVYVFQLLNKNLNDPFNKVFNYVLDNRQTFDEKFQKANVELMITNVYEKYARSLSNQVLKGNSFDKLAYENFVKLMKKSQYKDQEDLSDKILIKTLEYKKDWLAYADKINSKILIKGYQNIFYRDYQEWIKPILLSNCNEPQVLKSTLQWIDYSIEINTIFDMKYIKKDWENKISILEKMKNKETELLNAKTELTLLNYLEDKQKLALKLSAEKKEMLKSMLKL